MTLILKEMWYAYDGRKPDKGQTTIISPGSYRVEQILNPFGEDNLWYVLAGTKVGLAKEAWEMAVRDHPEGVLLISDS